MGRSTRLLALLQALRGRRHPVTAAALAQELEVSERTIYRDLSELASQGAPIQGEAGVGYILGPGLFLPPLMLTEDETEAVLLGLRYVDQRGDEMLKEAGRSARAKIISILSPEMQAAAAAPLSVPGPDGHVFPENAVSLGVLRFAIRTQRRIAIQYTDDEARRTERYHLADPARLHEQRSRTDGLVRTACGVPLLPDRPHRGGPAPRPLPGTARRPFARFPDRATR